MTNNGVRGKSAQKSSYCSFLEQLPRQRPLAIRFACPSHRQPRSREISGLAALTSRWAIHRAAGQAKVCQNGRRAGACGTTIENDETLHHQGQKQGRMPLCDKERSGSCRGLLFVEKVANTFSSEGRGSSPTLIFIEPEMTCRRRDDRPSPLSQEPLHTQNPFPAILLPISTTQPRRQTGGDCRLDVFVFIRRRGDGVPDGHCLCYLSNARRWVKRHETGKGV